MIRRGVPFYERASDTELREIHPSVFPVGKSFAFSFQENRLGWISHRRLGHRPRLTPRCRDYRLSTIECKESAARRSSRSSTDISDRRWAENRAPSSRRLGDGKGARDGAANTRPGPRTKREPPHRPQACRGDREQLREAAEHKAQRAAQKAQGEGGGVRANRLQNLLK